jgi:prefoldin subunit 5
MRNKIVIGLCIFVVLVGFGVSVKVYKDNEVNILTNTRNSLQSRLTTLQKEQAKLQAAKAAEAAKQAEARKQLPANAQVTDQCVVVDPTTKKTSTIQGDCSQFGL